MKLSIVILNWNVAGLLVGCLRSLPEACGDWWARTEVIVVDNASTDDSVARVQTEFPEMRVIVLGENRGFTAGNNIGIEAAKGDYIFVLNPDTIAHPGSIAALVNYMEARGEVGIAGPRLLNADGTTQPSRRRFPTIATGLIESTPLQRYFENSSILRRFYIQDRSDDEAQDVDWLSGAALMCRREMLAQIGPFDTGYFMFSEEVDLCKRAGDAGWRTAYVPQSKITHFGGGSTDQAVAGRHIHFNTSKARYFRLHEGPAVGGLMRLFLLGTYVAQMAAEGAKWALGHKRAMRAERVKMYSHILKSGLHREPHRAGRSSVVMITGEFPPARGGVGDYTCRLSLALQEQGVGVGVVTGRPTTDDRRPITDGKSISQHNTTRNRTTGNRQPATDNQKIPVLRPNRITVRSVMRALRRSRARVAHIQYQTGAYEMRPTANLLPLALGMLWGRATVVTFHDLLVPYLFPKAGPVREWANRILARGATAVVATNEADASRLRGWGVRRVELIPIGSNIRNNPPAGYEREEWRSAHNIALNATVLAYFGFLNSTKGLDSLLRMVATLEKRVPSRYRLMMVGGGLGSSDPTNRATAEALDTLARQLGIADRLFWTGYLEPQEVSAALLAADIAVLPFADGATFRRGSLLAVLEHGLPVVTTGGRKSEVALVNGENVVLVAVGDEEGLLGSIERLAGDELLRKRLSEGALILARHFSWEAIAEKHLRLYAELLGGEVDKLYE